MVTLFGMVERLEESELVDAEKVLQDDEGVLSVKRSNGRSQFMLVEFDEKKTNRVSILRHATDKGLHPKIAGC